MEQAPLKWKAREYIHSEKTTDWFWSVGLIALVLIIIAILMENILFALVIIIATIALTLLAVRKPEVIEIEVTQRGIRVDSVLYPYASLDSFWVEDRFFEDKLILKSNKPLTPLIILPVENIDPHILQDFLLNYLPEEEHEEPFSQKFMEWLGF